MVRRDRRALNSQSTVIEDWHELKYDAKGKIIRIDWCYPDGRRYLVFERVTRKTSLKTLERDLLQGLTAAIWWPYGWHDPWQELDVQLSPELAEMCAAANQDIAQNERDREALVFMVQLAQALNKAQLPIRRADEFVSVVLFLEQGNLEEQVEQQITAKTRKKLRQGGWLPG